MCCLAHLVLGRPTIERNVEAGMGMGGNGNELSLAIREWEWFFKCVNFGNGNGNGKDLAGMGGIRNTENHFRTSLQRTQLFHMMRDFNH